MYDPVMIQPMRDQLTDAGFKECVSAADVEKVLEGKPDSMIYVLNSVCGCGASSARPGVIKSLEGDVKPDEIYTSFAGNDTDAVNRIREELSEFPNSSPCIALFKEGKLVQLFQRGDILNQSPDLIALQLKSAYKQHFA